MLSALTKISGSFQQTVQSVEAILDPSREETMTDRQLLQVYKELLVESQFEHSKMFRSLQNLLGQKELRINELTKKAASPENDSCTDQASENDSGVGNDCGVLNVDSWQREVIQRNIEAKLDAIAESRIQKETVNALKTQLDMLKQHVRDQDDKFQTLMNEQEKEKNGNESAIENMAMEYSALSRELEEARHALEKGENAKVDDVVKAEVDDLKKLLVAKDEEIEELKQSAFEVGERMEKEGADMQQKLDELIAEREAMKEQRLQLDKQHSDQIKQHCKKNELMNQELMNSVPQSQVQEMIEEHEIQVDSLRQQHTTELEELKKNFEVASRAAELQHKEEVEKIQTQLDVIQEQAVSKSAQLEKLLSDAVGALSRVESEKEQMRCELLQEHEAALEECLRECREKVTQAQVEKEDMQHLYKKESSLRKKVHNALMDLKGNIRVYCRVRPIPSDSTDIIEYPVEKELIVRRADADCRFEFDGVFGPNSKQLEVFEDVSGLVLSALDGYNVCIFAYGQTGSGKTYTMEGTPSNPGVNLLALEKLFSIREDRKNETSMVFSVSVLEIYNENVRDLLSTEQKSLELRLNTEGKVFAKGLESVECSSMKDVTDCMKKASKSRTVGSHNMNEHSSRSHLVVTVKVETENRISHSSTQGSLCLIDLAGSERVGKTDATGERLKEAQNINRSLSALGDVISALGEKKKKKMHIPYRNSKLTFLLQNSLGGDSKVAMFVNISPSEYNEMESMCSLKFAERCRQVQLGQARKHGDSGEVVKYRKIIEDLRSQLSSMSKPKK